MQFASCVLCCHPVVVEEEAKALKQVIMTKEGSMSVFCVEISAVP